jgi:hypothetical protein
MDQARGTPYRNIRKAGGQRHGNFSVDVKETYLKGEILRQGQESTIDYESYYGTNAAVSQGASGPPASASCGGTCTDDVYMYFDSTARDFTSNLTNGEITFNVSTLNLQKPLDNVVSIRIDEFYIPRIQNANTFPDYFFFGTVFVRLASTSLPVVQSVLAQNGNTFHFECDIENLNSVAVKLIPKDPIYYFRTPIQSLSDLTFQFMVPLNFRSIILPNDTLIVDGVAGTNPAQFIVVDGNTTSPIGDIGVPTAPGVAVYFLNFLSPNITLNNTVVSTTGYFVTNIVSATTFIVGALNFATLPVNTRCTMIVAKNRIGITARFKSIRNNQTNGLVATNV